MKKDFTATIRETNPRYQDWLKVLGTNEIALKSPYPHLASAPGHEADLFFDMDLAALSSEQRTRLIAHLAERFQVPVEEVARDLDQIGCPILFEDVIVVIHNPFKWL